VLVVCGEAVIDLISDGSPAGYQARPGGSPLNVAAGSARLGIETAMLARLCGGRFGELLRLHLTEAGVDLKFSVDALEPATLAVLSLDHDADAVYDFYLQGTADWGWSAPELPDPLPAEVAALHVGSLASWRAPSCVAIAEMVLRESRRGQVLISFDPNVREAAVDHPGEVRVRIAELIQLAHIVKVSVADITWLCPGESPAAAAARWAHSGPDLVVLTDGSKGAIAYRQGNPPRHVAARKVPVVDTVGAGDAFTAGLLAALADRGRLHRDALVGLDDSELDAVLGSAAIVAALSCTRQGADPPTRVERDAWWART